jgi:hypothetical protein
MVTRTPATLILADLVVVPVLAVTVKVPVHDPVPDPCTVTHDVVVDVVHSHDGCVVTVITVAPPAGGTTASEGVTANVHDALG